MTFRKKWRTYQSQLLDRLDDYLDDGRLHLIAAPGSGKTVLGLEVIRRIGMPTLVLAPTITIRDQWVDRLVQLFLPPGVGQPAWVSTNLRDPAFLTVATYQALHTVCCAEPADEMPAIDESAIPTNDSEMQANGGDLKDSVRGPVVFPEFITDAGFKALVLDEAHHLRTEWWRILTAVAEKLEKPTIIALTATPPYDVSPFEWQRYEELCGPVDAEVSVPELVREGDLCPHQDHVYYSTPNQQEQKVLSDFRASVDRFVLDLKANTAFREALLKHRWILAPDQHTEEILDDPEYLSSMAIYLNAAGQDVPKSVLRVLGLQNKRIPSLGLEWLEVLLSRCLYSDSENFRDIEPLLKDIRRDLLRIGAIERRKVTLRDPSDHLKLLTTSVTKLKSVEEIVRLESGALGEKLRSVVLTDFIRKSELPRSADENPVFEDIGIVPVFETLRRAAVPGIRLGVLSGSLVIVPRSAEAILREAAATMGVKPQDFSVVPLAHDPSYATVQLRGEYYRGVVRLITSAFEQGSITVLVGTKSLLGEGWDAPCINTLVLASFVGSFMLSNQMRGRAIRVDPSEPKKTANIWHLVCAEPGLFGPGDDYQLLSRRCSGFAGVSATAPVIENGIERLGTGRPPFSGEQLALVNARTCRRALDRQGLRQQWQDALAGGSLKQMTEGLKVPNESMPRGFVLSNTIAALLFQAAFIFVAIVEALPRALGRVRSGQEFWHAVVILLGIAAIVSAPWSLLALWRLIRHGTPERSIKQIGRALLESLEYSGSVDHSAGGFRVYADRNRDGTVFCWIGGGTGKEQAIFLRALREILNPLDNPRYLLARRKFWRIFREDYFAVPEVLGRKKEFAEAFAACWKKRVGPVELVFTRNPDGRKLLLRARNRSLAASFQKQADRVSCWK
ncbi:MAG TPA: DEAD/DEAH box helicase family protein [Candidatus Sulfotelmatobacter sp.]|nr:DEAD/DEAH box helicase family protein [Candidatus Sulfotelmatobacter sp.]